MLKKEKTRFEWSWQQFIFFVLIGLAVLSLAFAMKGMVDRMSVLEKQVQEVRALALMPE